MSFIQKNCANFSSENQIVICANNNETDNIIGIHSMIFLPIMTYSETMKNISNITKIYYQFCGPMILIAKEFAKKINAK